MALTIRIRADATQFRRTIAGLEVQASGLTGVLGKLATSQAAFGAALAVAAAGAVALGAGLAFIKDASGKAAMMESLEVKLEGINKYARKALPRRSNQVAAIRFGLRASGQDPDGIRHFRRSDIADSKDPWRCIHGQL
jgi:hypothetical protein